MATTKTPAIERLILHHEDATKFAKKLGIPPQHAQMWVRRGWASPLHVLSMEHLLPDDVTIRDLLDDRRIALEREAAEALAKERAAKRASKAA